ncbi:MAG: DNA polymerase IV [Hyphomicrobiales bacterium]|nr:MAG: DNA polymerase IV [Hyphomicrobiales bacterium]
MAEGAVSAVRPGADQGLCRDCSTRVKPATKRCPKCHSPRLIFHAELYSLTIAHIDCDAFYAAIEKRDDPSLRDRPVIVGGGRRGVVATACYLARISGVRSAMPMFKAREACPDAVVITPDMEKYVRVGRELRAMMQSLTPLVEPLSIDEAFLDLSGTEKLHRATPAETLVRFARTVEAELGITISIGLAPNKFLAKVASDLDKPRGFSVIGAAEARSFLADKPVGMIWGVGRVMQKRLADDGIRNIGMLQKMDEADLMRRYGTLGQRLARLSRGEDSRTISPDSKAKSVSAETTFDTDIDDPHSLERHLRSLSEKVSARLKAAEIAGHTVTLKLKGADFRQITRSRHLTDPTQLADRIFRVGRELLLRETNGRRYRLIGIGVADLVDGDRADPPDLVDIDATRRAKAELAMDSVRGRFGKRAVELGLTLGGSGQEKVPRADREDD